MIAAICESFGKEFAPGDRMGVPWMQFACGECAPCSEGAEMLCAAQRGAGVTVFAPLRRAGEERPRAAVGRP